MKKLLKGDCLDLMKDIPVKSIDMILCDLPYGTTACKWDNVIPFEPFSSALRMSNIKNYKYDWIWRKSNISNFLNAKKQPLKEYETISVFNSKVYYPQGLVKNIKGYNKRHGKNPETVGKIQNSNKSEWTNYPKNILEFKSQRGIHPTQKPVDLLEYLIKTYTLEGETVLDNCMGSGSTGVACINTNRNFIGMELEEKYFDIAKNRIENEMEGDTNDKVY